MSDEKFTSGEWAAHLGIMEPTFVYVGKEDDYVEGETPVICELHHGIKKSQPNTHSMDFDHTEMNANATLISAAPEMYSALRWQCVICRLEDHETECDLCRIGDALKKARGENGKNA